MASTERRRKVEEIFAHASELPREDWAEYLDEACGGDAWLRDEVEDLLLHMDEAKSYFEGGNSSAKVLAPQTEEPATSAATEVADVRARPHGIDIGRRIGPYLLTRPLAAGGMGSVYLATRDDAEFDREVAVKLIRYPGEAAEFASRFRQERQFLAKLEHPNIATLFDGGTTEDGRPYLVMEYIEGKEIDEYCNERGLSVRERVALFREVCAAVAYAHRRLVVHRDVKPSNILVGSDGIPKLLDFGIAKPLEGVGETRPGGAGPMSLPYAAPEQIQRGQITTATDVYGLGVLLYKLLAPLGPYRPEDPNEFYYVAKAILELDPVRPSVSATEAGNPARARELRGDLDAIILQAIEKEPERRYRSAEALSEDLGRFLEGMPVTARGRGFSYVAGKLLRRYRLPAIAAGLVLLLVVGFVVALLRKDAELVRERDKAHEALGFMVDAFKGADPELARGDEVTVREVLDGGAAKLRAEVSAPDVRSTLLSAMGEVYVSLGLFDQAEPLLTEALELRSNLGPRLHAEGLYQIAELAYWRRDYVTAEGRYRETLAAQPPTPSVARARSLRGLGRTLVLLGQEDEGEALLVEALAMLRQFVEETHPDVLRCLEDLARTARDKGDYATSERLFREVVATRRPSGSGPALGRSLADLGDVRYRQGALADARALHEEALPILRESLGANNPYVAEVLGKLVAVLGRLGDDEGAEQAIREILEVLPENHPGTGTALHNLGMILADRGKLEEAAQVAEKALKNQRQAFGDNHTNVAAVRLLLGRIALERGDLETARTEYEASMRVYPPGDPRLAFPFVGIGRVVEGTEGCEPATEWYRKAWETAKDGLGKDHFQTARAEGRLGACLTKLGQYEESETLLTDSLKVLHNQGLPDNDPRILEAKQRLRELQEAMGR